MRLFLYPLILTIALLFPFAEIATPILQHKKETPTHVLPVHKTLYLGRDIYDTEAEHILEAAIEWNEATNGQVVFDIKKLPSRDIKPSDGLVIFNVTPDFPDIILLDNINHLSTLGYYEGNATLKYIALVDERIPVQDVSAVALHELGHALGLQHPNSQDPDAPIEDRLRGVGSLMYSNIDSGSNHITTLDLQQFCRLYHCDWKKLHGVPEVQ